MVVKGNNSDAGNIKVHYYSLLLYKGSNSWTFYNFYLYSVSVNFVVKYIFKGKLTRCWWWMMLRWSFALLFRGSSRYSRRFLQLLSNWQIDQYKCSIMVINYINPQWYFSIIRPQFGWRKTRKTRASVRDPSAAGTNIRYFQISRKRSSSIVKSNLLHLIATVITPLVWTSFVEFVAKSDLLHLIATVI